MHYVIYYIIIIIGSVSFNLIDIIINLWVTASYLKNLFILAWFL